MPVITIHVDADLDELRRAANKLYRRRPCRERINCLARERDRPLVPIERGYCLREGRQYSEYDTQRMCDACLAFWHAEMSARTHELGAVIGEKEETRPLPQKG